MGSSKVVLVYHHIPPFPGAVAMRYKSVAHGIRHSEHFNNADIEVIAANAGDGEYQSGFTTTILPGYLLSNSKGLAFRLIGEFVFGLQVAFRVMRIKPKAVVLSSPLYISSILISHMCMMRRIKYVLEVRDLYPQVYKDTGVIQKLPFLYGFFNYFSKKIYRNAELIVSLTKGIEQSVAEDSPGTPVTTLYNGFPSSVTQIKTHKHPRFTLCFHGILGFYQDVEMLLDLARSLENESIDIVVVGYGRKSELLQTDAPSNLKFMGRLPNDKTLEVASKCHVGLSFRLDAELSGYSFPVKIWEYLGLGLPVVIAPYSEAGDFVSEVGCGYQFKAGDLDNIRESIIKLKEDADLYQRFSIAAKESSREYTREKMGEKFASEISKYL